MGGRRASRSVYASLAAVQAVAGGAVGLLQQLAVPWGGLLDTESMQQRGGWRKQKACGREPCAEE